MKKIDLDNLTNNDLINGEELIEAYKQYLRDELFYDEFEVQMASEDLKNPYETPYIVQEYEGDYEVEGIKYSVRSCETNFCICGLFHLADATPFKFYMLFDKSTMSGTTVGDYMDARKMYILK